MLPLASEAAATFDACRRYATTAAADHAARYLPPPTLM